MDSDSLYIFVFVKQKKKCFTRLNYSSVVIFCYIFYFFYFKDEIMILCMHSLKSNEIIMFYCIYMIYIRISSYKIPFTMDLWNVAKGSSWSYGFFLHNEMARRNGGD